MRARPYSLLTLDATGGGISGDYRGNESGMRRRGTADSSLAIILSVASCGVGPISVLEKAAPPRFVRNRMLRLAPPLTLPAIRA